MVRRFALALLSLISAYALGVWLRSLCTCELLTDDPYIHLRYAEYLMHGGLPKIDVLRRFPTGFDPRFELPLVSIWIALFSIAFETSPHALAPHLPAFFAPLAAFPAYALAKRAFNELSGVLASLYVALAPGYVLRSFCGFCDKEAFAVPFLMYFFAFALLALEQGDLRAAVAAGLCLGVCATCWMGFLYGYLVLAAYAAAASLFLKNPWRVIPHYLLMLAIPSVFAAFTTTHYGGFSFFKSVAFLGPVAAAIPLAAARLGRKWVVVAFAAFAVLSFFLGGHRAVFGRVFNPSPIISESRVPSAVDVWNCVNVALPLSLPALYPMASTPSYLLIAALLATSLPLVFSQYRLLMFPSLICSILSGVSISKLAGVERAAIALALIPVLSTTILPVYVGSSGSTVSYLRLYSQDFSYSDGWADALVWLRQNSPQDAVVVSWWDYGYIIQYYAKRATISDPVNASYGSPEIAKFFMSENEDEALSMLDKAFGLRGRPTYVAVSLLEIPKSWAIADMAEAEDAFEWEGGGWVITRKCLLAKMVTGIEGVAPDLSHELTCFKKVYSNQHVAIYRVEWEQTAAERCVSTAYGTPIFQ